MDVIVQASSGADLGPDHSASDKDALWDRARAEMAGGLRVYHPIPD